jgi:hypothetical protein
MASLPSFNSRAVQPLVCFNAGWALIKDRYWLFLGVTVVAMLLASLVPLGILMGPMMSGMYLVFFEQMRGRPVEFNLLFKGFDRFSDSLIATLIQLGAILVSMLPFVACFVWAALVFAPRLKQGGGNPPEPAALVGFISVMGLSAIGMTLLTTTVSMLFSFTYPLIIDRNLSGVEAVQMSFKAAWANFWGLLGMLALNLVLGMVGVLFCYVGVFFILPITFAALATAYRQVFGLNEQPLPPLQTSA